MNSNELNILDLILHASLPVKIVIALLLAASIASWMIIFRKKQMIDRALRAAADFEERFWSGADLASLFKDLTSRGTQLVGLEGVFEAGFREFARLRGRRTMDPNAMVEGAQRAMRVALTREVDRLEQNLEFLATVGSTSPYVGLFGTVWGIIIAFQCLQNVKEATIAMVAPGISEALIATAAGLGAAIPAVMGYNYYVNRVKHWAIEVETFSLELLNVLGRSLPKPARVP